MRKDKESLMLTELCTRLPYGLQVLANANKTFGNGTVGKVVGINLESGLVYLEGVLAPFHIDEIKPYLRPLSSMTDDEKDEFDNYCVIDEEAWMGRGVKGYVNQSEIMSDGIEWLLERHFDFHNLIEKGLAIPAPDGMYNLKQK